MHKRKDSVKSEKCHFLRLPNPPRTSIFVITNSINFCPSKSYPKAGTTFKCTEFLSKLIPYPNKNRTLAALGECLTIIVLTISRICNEGKKSKCNKNFAVINTGNSGVFSSYIWIYRQTISCAAHIQDRIFNIVKYAFWPTLYKRCRKDIESPVSVYRRELTLPKNKKSLLDNLRNLIVGYSVSKRLMKISSKPLIDSIIFIESWYSEFVDWLLTDTFSKRETWQSLRYCSSIPAEFLNNNFNKLKIS